MLGRKFARHHSHGGEPRRVHRPPGRERRLARNGRQRSKMARRWIRTSSRISSNRSTATSWAPRPYETALGFEAKGFGWAYGDTPVFVLTGRSLPKTRESVEFVSGDLAALVNEPAATELCEDLDCRRRRRRRGVPVSRAGRRNRLHDRAGPDRRREFPSSRGSTASPLPTMENHLHPPARNDRLTSGRQIGTIRAA